MSDEPNRQKGQVAELARYYGGRDATAALRDLVAFVDGLTYEQLENVPGLFDATRKARLSIPDDPIAIELRGDGK